jgi:hypothetical protein
MMLTYAQATRSTDTIGCTMLSALKILYHPTSKCGMIYHGKGHRPHPEVLAYYLNADAMHADRAIFIIRNA